MESEESTSAEAEMDVDFETSEYYKNHPSAINKGWSPLFETRVPFPEYEWPEGSSGERNDEEQEEEEEYVTLPIQVCTISFYKMEFLYWFK